MSEEPGPAARGEDHPKTADVDPHAPVRGENPTPRHPIADVTETIQEKGDEG